MIEWALVQQIWPLILTVAAVIVWGARLEGVVGFVRREVRDARMEMKNHYATKDHVTEISGRIAAVQPQLSDLRASMDRVEKKIDALLLNKATLADKSK